MDPANGKTLARYPIPGESGVHGLDFSEGKLWINLLHLQKLSLVNPGDFRLIRQISMHLGRAHGLAWDRGAIWSMHSTNRIIHKLAAMDGRILEAVVLSPSDPEPHGMCLCQGRLYCCGAGIAPGAADSGSPHADYICRIDL